MEKYVKRKSLSSSKRCFYVVRYVLCSFLSMYYSLSLYNSVILPRVLKFYVHNQHHRDIFVQSDFSSLSLILCINCFSPQITELLGTQCFATVVASAAFGSLPTSTGRIFLLLNCQVGIALHSKGRKVKVLSHFHPYIFCSKP